MFKYLLTGSVILLLIPLLFSIFTLIFLKHKAISIIFLTMFSLLEIVGICTLYFYFIHDNSIPQQINIGQLEKIHFKSIDKNELKRMFSDYKIAFDRGESDITNDFSKNPIVMVMADKFDRCYIDYYRSEADAQTDFSLEKEIFEKNEPALLIGHGNNCQYLITNINKSRNEWGISGNRIAEFVIQSGNIVIRVITYADTEDEIIEINDSIINDILIRLQTHTK